LFTFDLIEPDAVKLKLWMWDCIEQNMRSVNLSYVCPFHLICPNNARRVTCPNPPSFALSQRTHGRMYSNGRKY
jgi:hypothetical protein